MPTQRANMTNEKNSVTIHTLEAKTCSQKALREAKEVMGENSFAYTEKMTVPGIGIVFYLWDKKGGANVGHIFKENGVMVLSAKPIVIESEAEEVKKVTEVVEITEIIEDSPKVNKNKSSFRKWLETMIEEKGVDIDSEIIIEGHFGLTYQSLVEFLEDTPKEHKKIKDTLIAIDFNNGDIFHYIKHLTECMIEACRYEGTEETEEVLNKPKKSEMKQYHKETLSALYHAFDFMECNNLPSKETNDAILYIENLYEDE